MTDPAGAFRPGSTAFVAGLGAAVSTFTVLPLPACLHRPFDRRSATGAMLFAPFVGAAIGAVAGAAGAGIERGSSHFLGAVVAVVLLAALTRGLHLDGLADTVDGLASYRPAGEALEIMRGGSVGPLGAVAVLCALLLDVAALTSTDHLLVPTIVAAAVGRLAITFATVQGIPSARPTGLGAAVAGTVGRFPAIVVAGLVSAGAAGLAVSEGGTRRLVLTVLAVPAGLMTAAAVRAHAVRRLGGITGDVLGACLEIATATALLLLACGR